MAWHVVCLENLPQTQEKNVYSALQSIQQMPGKSSWFIVLFTSSNYFLILLCCPKWNMKY